MADSHKFLMTFMEFINIGHYWASIYKGLGGRDGVDGDKG